jgi:sigma-B regulation protein RsbU (phosphoserine phosphatase)
VEAGLPLGIDADAAYNCTVVELTSVPATLYLHTDGVTEAKDPDRAEFGHDRLLELLSNRDCIDPTGIIDDVMSAVRTFAGNAPQSDDITMLAVQVG